MGVVYADWADVGVVAPIPLPDALQARVNEYLNQASVRLRALVPGLDNRLASGALEADLVKGVVIDAVLRLVYNPVGSQSQTAGPFNMSQAGGVAKDHIAFDPEVLADLLGPGETIPGTFGVSVAVRPGVPRFKTLPGMPIPGPVGSLGGLDAWSGYPRTPEGILAWWAAAGATPWWY